MDDEPEFPEDRQYKEPSGCLVLLGIPVVLWVLALAV